MTKHSELFDRLEKLPKGYYYSVDMLEEQGLSTLGKNRYILIEVRKDQYAGDVIASRNLRLSPDHTRTRVIEWLEAKSVELRGVLDEYIAKSVPDIEDLCGNYRPVEKG